MTAELHLEHLSGRWDKEAALLDADVSEAQGHVDIMTLTEVRDGLRPDVLPRRGWTVLQDRANGDMAECAILVRDETWRVAHWRAEVLGPDMGPGGRVVGVFAVLVHRRTGLRVVVGTAHLPSAVEGTWLRRGRRVVVHQRSVQRARRRMRRMYRRFGCDAALFAADWNVNLRRDWVQRWVRAAWPVMRTPKHIPNRGTHRSRLIDWPVARRIPNLTMRILPPTPASDHRRIRVTGTITRRKR